MKKRLLSVFLVLAMMLTMLPLSALAFDDVPKSAWYADTIEWSADREYYVGVTTSKFAPDDNVTRCMFVSGLYRYASKWGTLKNGTAPADFSDVPDGLYYTKPVKWAASIGLVVGDGDGKFRPNDFIKRQEMAVIMAKFVTWFEGQHNVKHDRSNTKAFKFSDEGSIASWAKAAAKACWEYELILGYGNGNYEPNETATRAQSAAMLYRLDWLASVTFDYNDGGKTASVVRDGIGVYDHEHLKDGHAATVKAPRVSDKDDAAFLGWYTKPEGGKKFDPAKVKPGDTYYAHWAYDYILRAVQSSAKWADGDPKADVNNAVKALNDWINKQLDTEDKVEGDYTDNNLVVKSIKYAGEDKETKTRTVQVEVTAETNSPSMLALGEFAVRYVYAWYGNGPALSEDIEAAKDLIKDMLAEVLDELGVTYTKADLDNIAKQLASKYAGDFKQNFLNVDGATCIDGMQASVDGQGDITDVTVPGVTTDDMKKAAKNAAVEIAKALRKSAQDNEEYSDWTDTLDVTATVNVHFDPTAKIADWYGDDGYFPEDYNIVFHVVASSDYLAYKYGDKEGTDGAEQQDYVKVIVPEKVKTAYEGKIGRVIDAALDSTPVQAKLESVSESFAKNVDLEKLFGPSITALLNKFNISKDDPAIEALIDQWLADNELAKSDSSDTIQIRKSFFYDLVNDGKITNNPIENKAIYSFLADKIESYTKTIQTQLDQDIAIDVENLTEEDIADKLSEEELESLADGFIAKRKAAQLDELKAAIAKSLHTKYDAMLTAMRQDTGLIDTAVAGITEDDIEIKVISAKLESASASASATVNPWTGAVKNASVDIDDLTVNATASVEYIGSGLQIGSMPVNASAINGEIKDAGLDEITKDVSYADLDEETQSEVDAKIQVSAQAKAEQMIADEGLSGGIKTVLASGYNGENFATELNKLMSKYTDLLGDNATFKALQSTVNDLVIAEGYSKPIPSALHYAYAKFLDSVNGTSTASGYETTMKADMDEFIEESVIKLFESESIQNQIAEYEDLLKKINKLEDIDNIWGKSFGDVVELLKDDTIAGALSGVYDNNEEVQKALNDYIGYAGKLLSQYGGGRVGNISITLPEGKKINVAAVQTALENLDTSSYDKLVAGLETVLKDYGLYKLSLSSFADPDNVEITVAYGSIDWTFYLVLEKGWK